MPDQTLLKLLTPITRQERALLNGDDTLQQTLYADLEQQLLQDGALMAVKPLPRFLHLPSHRHGLVTMLYMLQGSASHVINGETVVLRAGELLLLGQNARHEILPAGQNDIGVIFLLKPEFFRGPLLYLEEKETILRRFLLQCLCEKGQSHFLYFSVSAVQPVQQLMDSLLRVTLLQPPVPLESCQIAFALLLVLLNSRTERLQCVTGEQETMLHVMQYIEKDYRTASLAEIAHTLHYDIAGLSRKIKEQTGKTFTELVQDRKMSQAAWLLTHTSRKVEEIAQDVGYKNVGHFHRLFASYYGTTPKKYREQKKACRICEAPPKP